MLPHYASVDRTSTIPLMQKGSGDRLQTQFHHSHLGLAIYSYFQVNRPRGKGTAMLCPYDRCGSNT
ncbi:hypothetical protein H6H01_33250 [Nostoc calcicola FACHB-3891]|nr:hypothetical protein [Nostoc calcicola FACHB-3891]MDZ8063163.1 hypothetical protein [Nostoc sp. EkiNYC01]